jgi:hypothetical protein
LVDALQAIKRAKSLANKTGRASSAFDQACRSLRHFAHFDRVRELVARRVIEAAKWRRDPIRTKLITLTR